MTRCNRISIMNKYTYPYHISSSSIYRDKFGPAVGDHGLGDVLNMILVGIDINTIASVLTESKILRCHFAKH